MLNPQTETKLPDNVFCCGCSPLSLAFPWCAYVCTQQGAVRPWVARLQHEISSYACWFVGLSVLRNLKNLRIRMDYNGLVSSSLNTYNWRCAKVWLIKQPQPHGIVTELETTLNIIKLSGQALPQIQPLQS